ncbi:MAG: sulfite exporter TauE/SafE family protein [Sphingobium limneticum]
MTLEPIQYLLGLASGALVGFSLGLLGGGGSILALPLIVYLVGVGNPHIAIGTSAFAVAVNAGIGLFHHAWTRNVNWRCGGMFAAAGILGAAIGSTLGKLVDGEKLLFLFALVMLAVGTLMLRRRDNPGNPDAECTGAKAPKVIGFGLGSGLFSGFFGIGGGFLIVPSLMVTTEMPVLLAVGTSLIAITAFGLTTAVNYALSGLIDWPLGLLLVFGGAAGSFVGKWFGRGLNAQTGRLTIVFAVLIFAVAVYMLWRCAQTYFSM